MLTELERETARVAFLPFHEGDGYSYGGGVVVVIGDAAIPLGAGQPMKDLAQEIARRWNAALAAELVEGLGVLQCRATEAWERAPVAGLSDAITRSRALLAKARAQGITATKGEKGEG